MGSREKNIRPKRRKRNQNLKGTIILLLMGMFCGVLIAFLRDKYLPRELEKGGGLIAFLSGTYLDLIIVFIGYLLHIIIHEAGHLIFGLMTGYSFVSFRVGSLTLIREDGRFKLKRYNIPGTAGQCLLMPPKMVDGKFPFVIYNLGGVLLNLLLSITAFIMAVRVNNLPQILKSLLFFSGVGGIFAALTNGIPLKIGGIANDGYNILSMKRDEAARRAFHIQLRVNGLLSQGLRLKDMDPQDFKLAREVDITNPLNTSMKLIEYQWYLDNMDFQGASEVLESLVPYLDDIIPFHKFEINCERIFLELVGECRKDLIDELYDKNLRKYIKAAKYMLGKKRLLMTYEAFYTGDREEREKYHRELEKLAKEFPIKGEADMEIMLATWVSEKVD